MDARTVAAGLGAGRTAIGLAMLAAPSRVAEAWVGAGGTGRDVTPVMRGFGAREVGIGLGLLAARGRGGAATRPWVLAGAAGDAADLLAGLLVRRDLPRFGVVCVTVLAGGAVATGAWVAAQDW